MLWFRFEKVARVESTALELLRICTLSLSKAMELAERVAANAPVTTVRPDALGKRHVRIGELDQVVVRMASSRGNYEAYQVANGQLRGLPIGANIDPKTGTLFWQTSPGYLGDYEFVVVDRSRTDAKRLTHLVVSVGRPLASLAVGTN